MGDNLPTVDLGTGRTAVAIGVGYAMECAVLDNGRLKCWGGNYDGQLGLGDKLTRGGDPGEMGDNLPAVDLGTGLAVGAIAVGDGASAGDEHACALLSNSSVKCWGAGGELGLGDITSRGDRPGTMGDNLPTVKLFSDAW